MFSRTAPRFFATLALRLTVWYAGIFTATSMLAFALVYTLMVAIIYERTDDDLREDIEEFAAFMRSGGLDRVKTELNLDAKGEDLEQVFFRLWTSDGRELMTTDLSKWPGLSAPREALATADGAGEPLLATLALPQREHNVRSIYAAIAPGVVLQIGESLEEDDELIGALSNGFLMTLAAVVMLGGPTGWFMARRALRGVRDITGAASEIADGALDRRVIVRSQGGELDELAQTFNTMLDRIQALIVGMREMTDNLAHDIRSPLGRIRAVAEMALADGATRADWELLATSTTEECDRLLAMVNTTLDIAEAESGAAKLEISDVDLVEIIHDACELFQTVAEDRRITLAVDLPQRCQIRGDRQRLQRVVANLLDNALKYTPGGGHVTIRLGDEGGRVKLSVEDTGVGATAEELPHIFERFYRCDRSRSEHGNGLGLSLALAFVRAQGGDIFVKSTPGVGSIFTVELARVAA